MHSYSILLYLLVYEYLVSSSGGLVEATLTLQDVDRGICADGSPFGIYIEDDPSPSLAESRNHVIVFMGGGSCANPDDCTEDFVEFPYLFTTSYNPRTLQGHTVISNDPLVNPSMHNYTKWMVPYCSRDFFLGDMKKGKVGNFTHVGAENFQFALDYWATQVSLSRSQYIQANSSSHSNFVLDNVVIVGVSAGALGLMNHIPQVREVVNNVGAENLTFILDSPSVLSDDAYEDKDFKEAMEFYVNFADFPLCNPSHRFSLLYESSSELPCCLSSHCLIRHDTDGLASFVLERPTTNNSSESQVLAAEKLLVLDSAYDPLSLAGGTGFLQGTSDSILGDSSSEEQLDEFRSMMETGGTKKARAHETVATTMDLVWGNGGDFQGRFLWIMTSCSFHTYLVPSLEIIQIGCEHSNLDFENFELLCDSTGQAAALVFDFNVEIRVWRTINTWNNIRFGGQSIHNTIRGFLSGAEVVDEGYPLDLRLDSCHGPNCLEYGNADIHEHPTCQSAIEIVDTYVPVPVALTVTWFALLALMIITSVLLRYTPSLSTLTKTYENNVKSPSLERDDIGSSKVGTSINLLGIHVSTKSTNKQLLRNVDLKLPLGAITGIVGRSGSGKSTLLKVLSENRQSSLDVSIDDGHSNLSSFSKAYLCQEDPVVAFGSLYPAEYLLLTANIYNASPGRLHSLYGLSQELFSRGETSGRETGLNPFFETQILNLSGGQRRILAIAALLLRDLKLLLLDEPLSGLDSVSCMQVMSALHSLTKLHDCAIVVSVHQPSVELLAYFDKIVILNAGKVVVDQPVDDPHKTSRTIASYLVGSFEETVRKSLRQGSSGRSFLSNVVLEEIADIEHDQDPGVALGLSKRRVSLEPRGSSSTDTSSSRRSTARRSTGFGLNVSAVIEAIKEEDDESPEDEVESSRTSDPEIHVPSDAPTNVHVESQIVAEHAQVTLYQSLKIQLQQVRPLAQRIHAQNGLEATDGLTNIMALAVMGGVLVPHKDTPIQIVLASAAIIATPTFLFTHKVFGYNRLWLSHRFEMTDKRISPLAFQLATSLFTFPVPFLSSLIGYCLLYAILGWDFSTFPNQVLFGALHLLTALQFGRVLSVSFNGDYGLNMKIYATVLLTNAVFSSGFVATYKFPDSLQFLFLLSLNFWALSGASLNIFHDAKYSEEAHCYDLTTCILSQGNVVGSLVGFSPLSHGRRAMGVITSVFLALLCLEAVLLQYRCYGFWGVFAKPRSKAKSL